MRALPFMALSTSLLLAWLAVYRLPFRSPARRRQVGMRLSDWTGLGSGVAFAIFGTVLYLTLGIAVLGTLSLYTDIPWWSYIRLNPASVVETVLAIAGASSLNALCMSVLYRVRPGIDVPGAIAQIQWISSILALPRSSRWIIPAVAAMVEELVFRGAILLGSIASGASLVQAAVFAAVLFTAGQLVLVSTPVQALVMAVSSVTLAIISTLLVAASGSIVPALLVHMSFAGFYTNMSVTGAELSGGRQWQNT